MGFFSRLKRRMKGGPSSPKCVRVAAVLQSFLDDELDADQTMQVLNHLDECRACGLEADTYRELKLALRRHGRPDPEMIDRLRVFADRLIQGEVDLDEASDSTT
jgi:anti-sigma factor RsiW